MHVAPRIVVHCCPLICCPLFSHIVPHCCSLLPSKVLLVLFNLNGSWRKILSGKEFVLLVLADSLPPPEKLGSYKNTKNKNKLPYTQSPPEQRRLDHFAAMLADHRRSPNRTRFSNFLLLLSYFVFLPHTAQNIFGTRKVLFSGFLGSIVWRKFGQSLKTEQHHEIRASWPCYTSVASQWQQNK